MTQPKMFITDIDGTLFRPDQTFSNEDKSSMISLKTKGVIRVAATGRSIFSLERSLKEPLSVDYLIFSTGGGIARYPEPFKNIIKKNKLNPEITEYAAAFLETLDVDYMIQKPIPDNHFFDYRLKNSDNKDFITRLNYYKKYSSPLNSNLKIKASQLLVIVPDDNEDILLSIIKDNLKQFSIIKATSPLDGKTTWIEILPPETSKSHAAAWLAESIGISKKHIVAIGNDYNDEDLLSWVNQGYVVENAPDDLKSRFKTVASNKNNGVSEAIQNAFGNVF